MGPFRAEQITPPTLSINEFLLVSLRDYAFLAYFACAHEMQVGCLRSVSTIPDAGSIAILSTVS